MDDLNDGHDEGVCMEKQVRGRGVGVTSGISADVSLGCGHGWTDGVHHDKGVVPPFAFSG